MSDMDIRSNLSQKEQERLAKIDKLDANKKRKKLIFAAVTVVLISFFVIGTVFGGMYILSYEGTEALPEAPKNYMNLPSDEADTVATFISLTEKTKRYDGTKLDVSFDVNIPDDSIVISGEKAESVKPLFSHIKGSVVSLISGLYESERAKGEYGTDFSSLLYSTAFNADDAKVEVVYNEETDKDIKFVFTFDEKSFEENGKLAEIFSTAVSSQVKTGVVEKLSEMVKISDMNIDYESFVVDADIEREKRVLNGAYFRRTCKVSCTLEFIGEYADFGTLDLSFTLELSKNYRFTRVEMFFTQDIFYVTKGASDEIKTKILSDESPADCVITYTSSNPEVLSVDGRFFKAHKVSAEPVTLTAEYSYHGVKYTDTCEFYVIVPVEGVKQQEKEATLKKGETKELKAVISPDDATLTKVYWFTTDESIVSVDENGKITAKNEGTASVYCITHDGNFKSSCAVTVSE